MELALQNLDNRRPPTEDCDLEWERMERNRERRKQEGEERRQRKALE